MAIEIARRPAPFVAPLVEPDQPEEHRRAAGTGWRRCPEGWVRERGDDAFGLLVQRAIVRYVVWGVQRQELCREAGYSPGHMQAWLRGAVAPTYGQPVLRLLREAGFTAMRAYSAQASPTEKKLTEMREALLGVLADVAWLLATDARPEAVRVRTLARLLVAGREPLGGRL